MVHHTFSHKKTAIGIDKWNIWYHLIIVRRVLPSRDHISGHFSTNLRIPIAHHSTPIRARQIVDQIHNHANTLAEIVVAHAITHRLKKISLDKGALD